MQLVSSRRLRRLLCASVTFAALTTAWSEASAQVNNSDEIIVTARRREETLKDVPVAVSAFSAAKLDQLGATDITALQQSTPNLTMQVARGTNSTVIGFIRGVGQQDPLWGFEPGVGLYVDDVYIARPQGAVLDIFDLDRIEVLRGPQGTLYGRNTIGGAVKYVTKKIGPGTEVEGKFTIGSYGEHDEFGSFKTRQGNVGLSIAIAKNDHDGYGRNLTTGAQHYNKDNAAGRVALEFTPTDKIFIRASADWMHDMSRPRHGHREVQALDILGKPIAGGEVLSDVYATRAGSGDENSVITQGVSLLAEYAATDALTFKSITAYRSGHTEGTIDFDNLPAAILDVPAKYNDHQFSQELQAVVNLGKLTGVAGFYYMNGTAAGAFDTVVSQIATTTATAGFVDTTSYAGFANFSYAVTEQLSLELGGRYTRDEKTGSVYRQNFTGLRSPLFGNNAAIPGLLRSNFTNSKDFSKFTPHASVSYKVTPDITTYASFSRGFKSGGFDMRADVVLTPNSVNGYAPETVDTYEVGVKGNFLDRRLTVNAALFHSSYKDQQVTLQTPVGASIASQVINAGKSTIEGAELEAVAVLGPQLTANLSVGYVNASFDQYLALDLTRTPPVTRDFAAERKFQNTPRWNGSAGLTFRQPAWNGSNFTLSPTVSYRSKMYMFEVPSALDQPSYWLFNTTAAWTSADEHMRISINAQNITDERYRVGGYNFPTSAGVFFGNSVTAYYGPPQTVTMSLALKF
ncbi:TonB-dependent receptor [Roseiterribacter gracilis]|uniref:TonB-dependent receptor n=1 Tax=Roseiterribacter gracilis TaxID=2812848 RepID=A0A8S8X8W2_9PROT|nr:TonB-dependent receptor [Rhodospirillales bacterium TMPK1]